MRSRYLAYGAMLLALLALFWAAQSVEAHEPVDLDVCQAEDQLGFFTFPIGQHSALLELCNEVGGTVGLVADPGPVELVRWMYDWGLYDPGYYLLEALLFKDTDLEEE